MECKVTARKSHYPKEVPFEVPEGWVWCNFPEIAELISGQDFPPEKYNSIERGIPYIIGASNIDNGQLRVNRWTECPSVFSKKGDVLVVCKGAGVGKVAINNLGIVHIARQIQAVRIQGEFVSSDFMRILIDWCVPSIIPEANGLIPGLKRELLLNVLLPIPPRNEQDRIVSRLHSVLSIIKGLEVEQIELETCIRKYRTKVLELAIHGRLVQQESSDEPAIELLQRLNPSFNPSDNLHYSGDLPKGWLRCRVSEAFEINPKVVGNDEDECAFVPMALVPEGYSNELRFEKKRWATIKKGFTRFADGDIGVAKISPCLENRKSVIFRGLPSGIGAGTTELTIFRPIIVIAEYGLLFFKSEEYVLNCKGSFNGVVGQQRVDLSEVRRMCINIPPISEQHRIVHTVEQLFRHLESIQRSNTL